MPNSLMRENIPKAERFMDRLPEHTQTETVATPVGYSRADIHMHTNLGDGWASPARVIEEATRRNLTLIAVTDHDHLEGPKREAAMPISGNTSVPPTRSFPVRIPKICARPFWSVLCELVVKNSPRFTFRPLSTSPSVPGAGLSIRRAVSRAGDARPAKSASVRNRTGDLGMAQSLVFLHTSPVHVQTFTGLLTELAPDIPARHVVDESLLSEACALGGITSALYERVEKTLLTAVAEQNAAVMVCTCSSIGSGAETANEHTHATLISIDRPLAAEAVRDGSRVIAA